ncbi:hypothetical protein JCGZ_05760 [Jatropha curcas]|uniref:Uncharacterized protein n=1 Tax=Jatropha curcas TaxID=180498 RepID=A0A067JLS7_JATCU|nr:hypothetical protein JCGZ_05760 [Jatropha curcas]
MTVARQGGDRAVAVRCAIWQRAELLAELLRRRAAARWRARRPDRLEVSRDLLLSRQKCKRKEGRERKKEEKGRKKEKKGRRRGGGGAVVVAVLVEWRCDGEGG